MASSIERDIFDTEIGEGAPQRAFGDAEKIAGLFQHAPIGQLEIEADDVIAAIGLGRAGIDIYVELGQAGRPGNDPLHLLVERAGFLPNLAGVINVCNQIVVLALG